MRTQEFPFSEGDYLSRVDELRDALRRAKADADAGRATTMLDGDPVELIEQALEALAEEHLAEMRSTRRYVVLKSVGRAAWRALKAEFPARKEGDPADDFPFLDDSYGLNVEAAAPAMVRAALVEPTFETNAAFETWMDETLSPGEWATLVLAAGNLALGVVTDPKLLPGSQTRSTAQN